MNGAPQLSADQRALLERRRAKFDEYFNESIPVLTDFVTALGAENPPGVVNDPSAYLPLVDAWLAEQAFATPPSDADKTWLIVRLGYYIGYVLTERHGGNWFVDESPKSRWFARYVVGKFRNRPKAKVDPNHAAAQFVAAGGEPKLAILLEEIGKQLAASSSGG